MAKKVAVLGSGDVGKVLAVGFKKHGYEVTIGSNHPEKLADWQKKEGKEIKVASFNDAAKAGELIVLAVKGGAAEKLIKDIPEAAMNGKTIIDATNPIADAAPENGVLRFFTSLDKSLMEQLQALRPKAHFVKAFNSVGNAFMVNPQFNGTKPTMFICGDSETAKKEVTTILDKFGWETADMGARQAARAIEPLCILWCIPGFTKNEWNHAFKLVKQK